MLPKPIQRPHPPVWMAATSESAIDWAASRGFSILMDPHCTHAELGQKRRHYGERMAAAGFAAEGRDIPMARLIAIADDAGRAAEIAARGAGWMVGSYVGPKGGVSDPVKRYVDRGDHSRHLAIRGRPDCLARDGAAELSAVRAVEPGVFHLVDGPRSAATD